MFKNVQKNLGSTMLNPGIKLSTLAIAVAAFCGSSAFAQDGTITAPGTFTNIVPSGQNSVTIELWGAGGNGSGIDPTRPSSPATYAAGGGGGGGYSLFTISVVPGDVYDGTVADITPSGPNGSAGFAGQPSKVSGINGTPLPVMMEAMGGAGGGASTDGVPGIGGAGGIGITTTGVAGGNGTINGDVATGGAGGAGANGGAGGAGHLRDGVSGSSDNNNGRGIDGTAPGGGGGGASGGIANGGGKSGQGQSLGAPGQAKFTYSATVLPVSLLSFDASASNNQAKLSWATASEANNNRFEVQRSSDNITYVTVATVKGSGTSSQKSTYVAYDENPENGVNYYKLVQIDNDGTTKQLAIKSVNFSFAQASVVNVYPNPASGVLNVNVNSKTAQSATATLIGTNGSVYLSQALQLNAGANTATINLSGNVAPGQYVLTVAGSDLQESVKIMVK